jgi:cellulose synthase/poly-beta-1,6-N-acetylglucosamine synthase-like glycosyltransferase
VPAHNEECLIGQTIAGIVPQLDPGDRVLVIADNCSDQTAVIAAKAGAEVIERRDATQRGKGFALACGVAALHASPPGIVAIIDADCLLTPGTLDALVRAVVSSQRPAQALYLMDAPATPRSLDCVSAFAFLVNNWVRPLGCRRLGIPCLLRGTGMAFPWDVINRAPLATGNLVEDLQLGIDLTFDGHAPVFCAAAQVTGMLPSDPTAAANQRRRWEHGHLRTITHTVLPTLARALRHARLDLLLLALDVAVPPLSLLVLFWVLLGCGLSVMAWATGSLLPLIVWASVASLLAVSILAAWYRFGRQLVSAGTLAAIPLYVFAKIPLYLGYLVSPQREWIRTDRGVAPTVPLAHAAVVAPPQTTK